MKRCILENHWGLIGEHDKEGLSHYFCRTADLIPIVKISYFRDSYDSIWEDGLRLTIDSFIAAFYPRQRISNNFFRKPSQLVVAENMSILEIKCENAIPEWIENGIRLLNLSRKSISKYGLGVERLYRLPDNH